MNKDGDIAILNTSGDLSAEEVYSQLTKNLDRDELLQRLAERENTQYLKLCNEYDAPRTISFDMPKKEILFQFEKHQEAHPIGNLLIHFLEADFSGYEQERQDTLAAYADSDTDFNLAGFPVDVLPPLILDQISHWGITPQEYSRKSVINKLIKFNIRLHPYLTFFRTDKLMQEDGNILLQKKCDMLSIQKQIADMLAFCLDVEYDERLKGLTALQRYFIYRNTRLDVPLPQFLSEIQLYPYSVPEQNRHIFREQKTNDRTEILNSSLGNLVRPKPLSDEQIEYVKKLDLSMTESCDAYDALSVALLELFKMIQNNLFVKKCGYCGRYFVLKYNYENKYCDRIPAGENKNCQTLGAMKDYQQEIRNNPARLAHKRAYKKINDYKNKGIVSESVYSEWIDTAKVNLNDCLAGRLPFAEFEQWLSSNSRGVRKC